MKKYRAVYKNWLGETMRTSPYKSLAICKRFTKKLNVVRYEELDIHYDMDTWKKTTKINVVQ